MRADIAEWVAKAEGDYVTAMREYRARKQPNYDSACFHAQQCIEKYLKGVLRAHRIAFAKTHDLAVLLKMCLDVDPLWEAWREGMETVSHYAVQFRYPGETATRDKARRAIEIMKRTRDELRSALRLPPDRRPRSPRS